MYFNPYAIPVFASGAIMLFLTFRVWRYRLSPGLKAFALLTLSTAVYAFFYALEISSLSLDVILFWIKFEYIGIVGIPITFILFTLGYTGRSSKLTVPVITALCAIPFLTLFLFWTNESHGLIYETISLNSEGPFPVINFERGLWYWVHTVYVIVAILISNILFMLMWLQSASVYRKQITFMLIGSLIPFVGLIVNQVRPFSWNIDYIPFTLSISGIFFFWGLLRLRLFELIPIARTKLFEELPDGVLFLDARQRVVDLNAAAQKYLPLTKGSISQPANEELQNWPGLAEMIKPIETKFHIELPRDIIGETFWFRVDFIPLQEENEVPYGQMILLHDITDRKMAENKLQILATTDELTGLWNRRHFMQAAKMELNRAKRYEDTFSVIMLDIDHFKKINDTMGHSTGDKALQYLASLVKNRVRNIDILGRLGGEEFCLLLPGTNLESAYCLAEDLRQTVMNVPLLYEGRSVQFTISLGVSEYSQDIEFIDDMLKTADAAMYRAKAQGRNCTVK